MKYRMLTDDELKAFEEDFKHFLIANGVSNEEWSEMNASNPGRALEMVGLFSDTVLQKVYEKIEFLEHRSLDSCMVFRAMKEEILLISINRKSDKVDLSTPESIHDALQSQSNELSIFGTSKKYSKVRELEIHDMISQGCVPSSQDFWDALKQLI